MHDKATPKTGCGPD